ncbi:TPA: hypothetical protein ACKRLB_001592 [Proteus mirabilis]|uniref:hypothetical protein n=1 Tax=Proteus mirabilis TaxID=584 RepID=UPI00189F60C2|nr:hypothetical protein [Proteus mirabilis]
MGYVYDTTVIDWDKEYKYANYSIIKEIINNEKDDDNIAAIITVEEAEYILSNESTPTPFKSSKDTLLGTIDFISNFSGNLYEAYRLDRIISEFGNINIRATQYTGPNGNVYIRLSGHPGVRFFLNGTRYLANNPRILFMGVGTQGINDISVGAARFAIVFSAAYRVVELIFKNEYTLVDFFVNVTMDMAKLAISAHITAAITGGLVTAALTTGTSVILVALGVFLLGVAIGGILYWLDNKFQISESIIKDLKKHREKKSEINYHPDQFFSQWGKISRG